MQNAGDNNVGTIRHPPISPGDRKPFRNIFKRRVNRSVIEICGWISVQIRKNKDGLCSVTVLFCGMDDCRRHAVEAAVPAEQKLRCAALQQFLYGLFQPKPHVFRFIDFAVPAKCNDHGNSTCLFKT